MNDATKHVCSVGPIEIHRTGTQYNLILKTDLGERIVLFSSIPTIPEAIDKAKQLAPGNDITAIGLDALRGDIERLLAK